MALPALCPVRRVLVVEDNPDCREGLQALLEYWGHEVEAARNGQQGVDMALAWRPDTVISDIGLPGLDGYQVARRVKEALAGRVRLIALTGYGGAEDRRRAFEAGFDHHLSKPAEPEELARLLGPS